MDQTQISGYLEVGRRHLYGTLFRPAVCRPLVVVLYEPFGEEKKSALRVMVRLARACAEQGLLTLRFDLSGTGESVGSHGTASWENWQKDAAAAAAFARTQAPAGAAWVAVGVRLGAYQALHAASCEGAAALALLEPVLSGEECLRDLERRQRIKHVVSRAGDDAEDCAARWDRGEAVDFGGFEVSAALAGALRQENLVSRLEGLAPRCPLQVLRVSGSTSFPPAWKPLTERAGTCPPGRATAVRDKPFWGQLEYYESDLVMAAVLEFIEAVNGQLAGPSSSREAPTP